MSFRDVSPLTLYRPEDRSCRSAVNVTHGVHFGRTTFAILDIKVPGFDYRRQRLRLVERLILSNPRRDL